MKVEKHTKNGVDIGLVVPEGGPCLVDGDSALELAMAVKYDTGASRIAIPKSAVAEGFFILSTGLAGEVLQKLVNYHFKLAIYGDFSHYTSKPLHDFILESNNGRDVFFVPSQEEAIARLAGA